MMQHDSPEKFMRLALEQARAAARMGEVPVGAVIVEAGNVIAASHNLVEAEFDATGHAEVRAIRAASSAKKSWRLDNCSLYVTLEPCPMCMGAIQLCRIKEIYFGCTDPRLGACGSVFDLSKQCGLPHSIEVYPQVLEAECRQVLQDFFAAQR